MWFYIVRGTVSAINGRGTVGLGLKARQRVGYMVGHMCDR